MKVYVIETGEYSSRSIHSIYSTKEQAEAFVKRINGSIFGGSGTVREYTVDEYDLSRVPKGMKVFCVVLRDGDADTCDQIGDPYYQEWAENQKHYNDPGYKKSDPQRFIVWTYARDREHAIKIASDRRAKWQAEQEGIA